MDSHKYPKVLIVTVNPLSTTSNNGKTYASFFNGYPKESIAQLYFHREIPTSDVCDNYYKISDEDIINYVLRKESKLGKRVYSKDTEERMISKEVNNFLKKSSAIRLIRSLLWLLLDLENEELSNWLDSFKPEIIFFCGGDANYLYNEVLKLSKKYNAKIVYYITDDYVLPYCSLNIFDIINRIWTRNVFKRMCRNSGLVLTIGDKMSHVYKEKYGINSKVIMNLVNLKNNKIIDMNYKKNDLKFIYTGGLHSNRWKTLSLIGKSIERLQKLGLKAELEIYSASEPEDKIMKAINNKNYSRYCGSLDKSGVERVLNEADVVVHVESFDSNSKRVTYLSVSTKISEYMAAGKCILAFGPEDVASIEYLKETNSGFIITSSESKDVDNILREIIRNPDKRNLYVAQGLQIAKENHEIIKRKDDFQQKIINLIK